MEHPQAFVCPWVAICVTEKESDTQKGQGNKETLPPLANLRISVQQQDGLQDVRDEVGGGGHEVHEDEGREVPAPQAHELQPLLALQAVDRLPGGCATFRPTQGQPPLGGCRV